MLCSKPVVGGGHQCSDISLQYLLYNLKVDCFFPIELYKCKIYSFKNCFLQSKKSSMKGDTYCQVILIALIGEEISTAK